MAGVIVAVAGDHSDLSGLIAKRRPIVAVDRVPNGFEIDAVTLNNRAGGRAATQALIDSGFKRIACITGPTDVETAELRATGWRQALTSAGLANGCEHYLRHTDYRVNGGRLAMRDLLEMTEPPDAVFVANNLTSVGALQALTQAGLAPPIVGMASFGDLPFSSLSHDAITLIHLPSRHMGETAAKLLLERINGDNQPPRTIVLRNLPKAAESDI